MANTLENARRLISAGRVLDGEAMLRQIVERDPGNESHVQAWCNAMLAVGDLRDGVPLLQRVLKAGVRHPFVQFCLALAYQTDRRFDEAHAILDGLLIEHPHLTQATHLKVRMLVFDGKHKDAVEILEPQLGTADPIIACAFGLVASAVDRRDEAVRLLARVLDDERAAEAVRNAAGLMLARLLDEMERFDEAMEAARSANRLGAATFDPAAVVASAEARIEEYTATRMASLPRATGDTSRPIYILGMPRSGTSLVEAMLGVHPDVGALGECRLVERLLPIDLTDAKTVQRMSGRLLNQYRELDDQHQRVTDKQLGNHWHLAAIRSLTPGARVIWCRRDPRDVCVSCFFQQFQLGASWSHDLQHIAAYHRVYDRLMEHWERVLDWPILRVQYEDLVTETGPQLERLLAHLGLAWDDRCLAFHKSKRVTLTVSNEQVRRRVYTSSIGRWRNYESHIRDIRR